MSFNSLNIKEMGIVRAKNVRSTETRFYYSPCG